MTAASAIRQPLWSALRTAQQPLSVPQLAAKVGTTDQAIAWRLSRWVRAGFLTTVQSTRNLYMITDEARPLCTPPALNDAGRTSRSRGGRGAMWRVMRQLRSFDLVQLRLYAEVTEASARQYVSCLLRAGILRCISRGSSASGERSLYALTGRFSPNPPIVKISNEGGQRVQDVLEPKSGRVIRISGQRCSAPLF